MKTQFEHKQSLHAVHEYINTYIKFST